ncbi:ferric-chelate reductase 1-like isoform X1 [Anguilla anguilla]|uniref:ferric-chelate reductase 1-like isoform X1 n=1 Tax=Anguilla anguilla TaxID=7936 RepID=UPI0015A9BA66|nr:ferric-chelate reductase 1-like isoform X1 [Anguilla anguilla]
MKMQSPVCLTVGVFVVLSVRASVRAYENGRDIPASTCGDLKVQHGVPAQTTPSRFRITANQTAYQPGDTITVTLSGETMFRGFLLVAQRVGGDPGVGTFTSIDPGITELLSCKGPNSAVAQLRNQLLFQVRVTWTAPPSQPLGDIVFRATFVQNYFVFWEAVPSANITGPAPPTTITAPPTTTTVLPTTTTAPPTRTTTSTTAAAPPTTTTVLPTTTTAPPTRTTTSTTAAAPPTTTTVLPTTTTAPPTRTTTSTTAAAPPTTTTVLPTTTTAPPTTTTTSTTAAAPPRISRDLCGNTYDCVSNPLECDPEKDKTCMFASRPKSNMRTVQDRVQMRGETAGYFAVGNQPNTRMESSNAIACAKNTNGTFTAFLLQFNMTSVLKHQPVDADVLGSLNAGVLRCIFFIRNITILPQFTNAMQVVFATGTFENGKPGLPNVTQLIPGDSATTDGSSPCLIIINGGGAPTQGLMLLTVSLGLRMLCAPV